MNVMRRFLFLAAFSAVICGCNGQSESAAVVNDRMYLSSLISYEDAYDWDKTEFQIPTVINGQVLIGEPFQGMKCLNEVQPFFGMKGQVRKVVQFNDGVHWELQSKTRLQFDEKGSFVEVTVTDAWEGVEYGLKMERKEKGETLELECYGKEDEDEIIIGSDLTSGTEQDWEWTSRRLVDFKDHKQTRLTIDDAFDGGVSKWKYDAEGRLEMVEDEDGRVTILEYNESGKVAKIVSKSRRSYESYYESYDYYDVAIWDLAYREDGYSIEALGFRSDTPDVEDISRSLIRNSDVTHECRYDVRHEADGSYRVVCNDLLGDIKVTRTYNPQGDLAKVVNKRNLSSFTWGAEYKYVYDEKGNWVKRIYCYDGEQLTDTRQISYWGEPEVEETPVPAPAATAEPVLIEEEEEYVEEAIPFQLVEDKPSFQGGDANQFSKWVNQRLVYPETAKENGVQGRVTLQFTVGKDGSVTDVKVLRSADPELDQEAVRVVSMSPKWEPGKQRGRAVPVIYTFPVIFQLK